MFLFYLNSIQADAFGEVVFFTKSIWPDEYGRSQYTTKNETIPVKQSAKELTCFLRQKTCIKFGSSVARLLTGMISFSLISAPHLKNVLHFYIVFFQYQLLKTPFSEVPSTKVPSAHSLEFPKDQ